MACSRALALGGVAAAALLLLVASPALAANGRTWSEPLSFGVQSTSSEISEKYDLSDKAGALRKTIPRAGMDTVLEIDMDADSNPDSKWFSSVGMVRGTYLDGIAILVGFGIIGVLLVLIWSCTFCWCRCCCCNCCCRNCGKTPKPEGYTFQEKLWPGILALVMLLVIIIFTCLGLFYNEEFTRGLADKDEGVVQLAINLVGSLDSFANQTQVKLQAIAIAAPATVVAISTYLDRAAVLAVGTNGLIYALQDVSRNMADLQIIVPGESPVPSLTYTCEFCKTVSTSISDIATQVKDKADPVFNSMNDTINTIDETLVEVQTTIAEQVNASVNAIGTVRSQVQDAQEQMQTVQDDYVQPFDSARRGVGAAILCIPFAWMVLVLLGAILKKGLPFGITYVTAWGIGILMFLLLAIHLPLAALTGDSCTYLNTQEGQIDTKFDDPRAGALINSCLLDTSMVEALNLTEQLDFANVISFPELPSIDESFSFDTLDSFAASVYTLSLATFNYTYDPATDLARINAITSPDIWTASNVSALQPETYSTGSNLEDVAVVNVSRATIIVQTTAGIVLNNTLNAMKANVSLLVAQKTALQAQTSSFTGDFYQIKQALQPLLNATQDVVTSLRCGFVGEGYRNIKESYCITTVTALSGLSLAFFMVATLGQVLAIASILLCTRLPHTNEEGKRAERLPVASPVDGAGTGTFHPAPSSPLTPLEAPTPLGETVQLQPMAFGAEQAQLELVSPASLEMVSPASAPTGDGEGAIFQYSDPGPQSPPTNAVQPY